MMGIRQLSQGEVRRDLTTKDTKESEGSRLGTTFRVPSCPSWLIKLRHTTQSKQEQQESRKAKHSTYCVQESPMPQELQGDIRIQVKCAVEQPAIRRQNDNQRKRYDRADQQRPDEPIQACSLNHVAIPVAKETAAKDACITVARL